MARTDEESTEMIVTVPLRRLLTGVPRPQRAAAAIPRIKRYVRRHVKSQWLEAVTTDDEPDGKLWIDDSLNMTIWRRGREHVAGPAEWEEPMGGGTRQLSRRTAVRYGSILKVRVYFNEDPEDGSDPRLEITLPGVEHTTRQEKREARRRKAAGEEEEGEEPEEGGEEETSGDDEEHEEEVKAPAPAPKPVKKESVPAAAKKEPAAAPARPVKKESAPAAAKKEPAAAAPKKKPAKKEGED